VLSLLRSSTSVEILFYNASHIHDMRRHLELEIKHYESPSAIDTRLAIPMIPGCRIFVHKLQEK